MAEHFFLPASKAGGIRNAVFPMKRLLLVVLPLLFVLAGCTSVEVSPADVEAVARSSYNEQLIERRLDGIEITDVQFIRSANNRNQFEGFLKYSDGVTISINATYDPETGRVMFTPRY